MQIRCKGVSLNALIVATYLTFSQNGAITCLADPTDKESSNAFLVEGAKDALLIDAGWGDGAAVPQELERKVQEATKVFRHFHFDHVRRLHQYHSIRLAPSQAGYCKVDTCDASQWLTVYKVAPFPFEGRYGTAEPIAAGVEAVPCAGHSQGDSCFIHPASRTLFPGDLFYLGPLFTFLPGGSLAGNQRALALMLQDPRWDRVAQTHGDCYASRQDVEKAAASMQDVVDGKVDHEWNFSFVVPLWKYPLATGSVYTVPFARQLDL